VKVCLYCQLLGCTDSSKTERDSGGLDFCYG